MSISATWDNVITAPVEADRRRAFRRARRHSRLVRRLRIVLPLAGAAIIAIVFVATTFSLSMNVDIAGMELSVTPNGIVMDNPHLTGFDEEGRHYSVQADRAVQALANPDQVRLEDIAATVTVEGQGTATITAAAGDYDNSESTLTLQGDVAIDSSEGYALRMEDADIDLGAGTMASANPVTISYQDSSTVGDSLSVTGGGASIVLEGNVRTDIMPPKRETAPAASTGELEQDE